MKKTMIFLLLALAIEVSWGQELLWQQCNSTLSVPTRIVPVRCLDNNHQSGETVQQTLDNDPSTIYHSAYSPAFVRVTPERPVELTYDFEGVERIDYLDYVPRQTGSNGWVSEAEIYVKTEGDGDYRLYECCRWPLNADTKRVTFAGGLLCPVSIRVRFLRGMGDYASCAEMMFLRETETTLGTEVFADDLCTKLKPGVSDEDIARMTTPTLRLLACQLKDGSYKTAWRVAQYDCYDAPQWLAEQWKTPGKCYDQLQGVTGIVFEPGRHLVVVTGLPDSLSASLKVVAWYTGRTGRNFDGGNPDIRTYSLHNGMNVIDYESPWSALAYVAYFTAGHAESAPPIGIHFVGGTVNGYLTTDMTDDQMHQLTAAAPSRFIDVISRKVHAVWTSAGMHEFCKADDGKSPGYRQYMAILDTLMTWEQRVVGFEKYGRVPRNRTLLYVNYTYGALFQSGLGISAHVDNERTLLNCRALLCDDSETIWGLSHEWGHQHQLQPFFCWGGLAEVTNNLNACYNLRHLGYRYDQLHPGKREGLERAVSRYIDNETDDCIFQSPDLFERLCPFQKLTSYFMYDGGKPDFLPDLYEALRHAEVQPDSTNVVPYVLHFIRTVSSLSGYDLTPYFERFGFLRVTTFEIEDYGQYFYSLTLGQLDDFRKEMSGQVRKKLLKRMPDGMVERIAHTLGL